MKTVFEIGISMELWAYEDGTEFPVYSVTLNVKGEYGCTSAWESDLIVACNWCISQVYDLGGKKAWEDAMEQFQKMFPDQWERFTLPF